MNEIRREQEPSAEISLRRATPEDVDSILAVEKSVEGTKIYSALSESSDEIMAEIVNNAVYLIEKGGEVVGDISYEMKGENHAYISGLAIMAKFQRQGIAKQAMKKILEELKDVALVDLLTHPKNERAIALYRDLDFEKTGEQIENYYGDGEPRTRMVLKRDKSKYDK